jgi:multidrug efflux pump subunit AcrA (membrane-fusion protein)
MSNHARVSEVSVGTDNGEVVEVLDGVAEGDTIVTRGQFRLSDNALVKIRAVERMN